MGCDIAGKASAAERTAIGAAPAGDVNLDDGCAIGLLAGVRFKVMGNILLEGNLSYPLKER